MKEDIDAMRVVKAIQEDIDRMKVTNKDINRIKKGIRAMIKLLIKDTHTKKIHKLVPIAEGHKYTSD